MAFSSSMALSGALLSGLLAFIPNPSIAQLGLAGSTGLAGYAVSNRKKQENQNRDRGSGRSLRHAQADLQTTTAKLTALSQAHQALKTDCDRAQLRVSELNAKLKAVRESFSDSHAQSLRTMAREQVASTANVKANLIQAEQKLVSEQAKAAEKYTDLLERLTENEYLLEQERSINADRLAEIRAEIIADTLATPSQLNELRAECDRLKARVAEWEKEHDETVAAADSAVETLASQQAQNTDEGHAEIVRLMTRIAELEAEAMRPGRFGGLGAADIMGNRVIDFYRSKGYQFIAHETDPDLDKGLLVSLKADSPISLEMAQSYAGELEVFTGTHSKPKVTYENRFFKFRLAVNEQFRPADEAKLTSNLDRLQKAIDLANHLAIFGGSGSGKSTFLDNAIWCGRCLWPDSKLDILDPKYPFTPWTSLKPTYKGGEATVDGVISIANTMNKRLRDATEEFDSTGEVPDYPRYIFAIDEATVALTEAKRLDQVERKGEKLAVNFGASLSSLLRLGRALNVKGYFLTQSLLVSKVGLNDGDYDNASRIYLNAMIEKALDKDLKDAFSEGKLKSVARELQRRKDANQKYIGLVADTNRDELFLFEPPAPGFYFEKYQQENQHPLTQPEEAFHSVTRSDVKTREPLQGNSAELSQAVHTEAAVTASHAVNHAAVTLPRAKCPSCSEASTKLNGQSVQKNGKRRFICQNDGCNKQTFSAIPE